MVDCLLRVHIQSQRAFGPWWTLSYNSPPYTDEPFMEHVKAIATFENIRAAPLDPTRRSVGNRAVNVQWKAGEHPTVIG